MRQRHLCLYQFHSLRRHCLIHFYSINDIKLSEAQFLQFLPSELGRGGLITQVAVWHVISGMCLLWIILHSVFNYASINYSTLLTFLEIRATRPGPSRIHPCTQANNAGLAISWNFVFFWKFPCFLPGVSHLVSRLFFCTTTQLHSSNVSNSHVPSCYS